MDSTKNSYNLVSSYEQKPSPIKTSLSDEPEYSNQLTAVDYVIVLSFIVFWTTLAIVLSILSPAPPLVQLDSLEAPNYNLTVSYPQVDMRSSWDMHLTIKNPEKRWKGRYYDITCVLFNEQTLAMQPLTETGVESFSLPPGKERGVQVKMNVHKEESMNNWEFTNFSVRVSMRSSFETPRSAWVVGKSFTTEYACAKLSMKFEHGRGTFVGHVPRLFTDKLA